MGQSSKAYKSGKGKAAAAAVFGLSGKIMVFHPKIVGVLGLITAKLFWQQSLILPTTNTFKGV